MEPIEFPAWVFSELDGVEYALEPASAVELFLYDYEGEVITVYDNAGFHLKLLADGVTVVRDSLRYEDFIAAARLALGKQRIGNIRWWQRETRPFLHVPEEDAQVVDLLARHYIVDEKMSESWHSALPLGVLTGFKPRPTCVPRRAREDLR